MTDANDIIIIGAGAAGLMCALEATRLGCRVKVIDGNGLVGKKIRVSGGGRCNFTHLGADKANYLSENPDFCVSALKRFPPEAMVAWMEERGLEYNEKTPGQLFCSGARDLVAVLERECEAGHVELCLSEPVLAVEKKGDIFEVLTKHKHLCRAVVVATGGLSYASLGASDLGYRIARQFDLRVTTLYPGLVPLKVNDKGIHAMSGVSIKARVTSGGRSFLDNVLFTHRGLSGPAILQISSYWREGEPLHIDCWPDGDVLCFLQSKVDNAHKSLKTLLGENLPKAFIDYSIENAGRPFKQYSMADKERLQATLHDWTLVPTRDSFDKAEVTCGGVDTRQISSKTFECLSVAGLYFVGEVLDVTGQLGGYNLQWAWASGLLAGRAIGAAYKPRP